MRQESLDWINKGKEVRETVESVDSSSWNLPNYNGWFGNGKVKFSIYRSSRIPLYQEL
jgi:hypothetical protein